MSSNGSSYRPESGYGQQNSRQLSYSGYGGNGRHNNYNQSQNNQQYNKTYQRKPYGQGNDRRGQGQGIGQGAPRGNYNSFNSNQNHSQNQSNQLWMGDLDPSWDEVKIKQIWANFGDSPIAVKLIRDRTGDLDKPLYCFVTFATKAAVASAIQKHGLQIPGSTRTFKLNWASGGAGSYSASSGGGTQDKNQVEYSVFVGDLGPDITELQLHKKFGDLYPNQVKSVKIMTNPTTKASKGFGFVKFHTGATQKKALTDTTPIVIAGRTLRVGPAGNNQFGTTVHSQSPVPQAETTQYASVAVPQAQPSLNAYTDPYNTTIKVKGISTGTISDGELATYFSSFGHIVYCKVVSDEGYVKYYTREEAETAMMFMYGTTINGCRVVLTWGKSKANKHEPEIEPGKYTRAPKAPTMYGNSPNGVFSGARPNAIALMLVDNEPHTVRELDDTHVSEKLTRDNLVKFALY